MYNHVLILTRYKYLFNFKPVAFKNHLIKIISLLFLINTTIAFCSYESQTSIKFDQEQYSGSERFKTLNLSLDQAQNMLLSNNLSIQIAYEKLYQARKNIIASRSMFFPDAEWFAYAAAAGPGGAAYVGGILLGIHLFSLPSKWFDYKAIKEMSKAEKYALAAVKKNIWGELAKIYYHILKDQIVLDSVKQQCTLHRDLVKFMDIRVNIGSASDAMLIEEQRGLNECLGQVKAFEGILALERAELKMLLNIDPRHKIVLKSVELSPISLRNMPEDDVEILALEAAHNSPELKQFEHLVKVSQKLKKSANLSILSFNGLGFGYTGRVKIAKSHVRSVQLNRRKALNEIRNQVYATHSQLKKQIELSMILDNDLKDSERQKKEAKIRYEDNLDSFKKYAVVKKRYIQSVLANQITRVLVKSTLADLSRQVGFQYNGGYTIEEKQENLDEVLDFRLKSEFIQDENPKKMLATIYLDGSYDALLKVESVSYKSESFLDSFKSKVSHSLEDRFAYQFKSKKKDRIIIYKIKLHDGRKITKAHRFKVS